MLSYFWDVSQVCDVQQWRSRCRVRAGAVTGCRWARFISDGDQRRAQVRQPRRSRSWHCSLMTLQDGHRVLGSAASRQWRSSPTRGVRLESLPEILEPPLVSNTELSKWGREMRRNLTWWAKIRTLCFCACVFHYPVTATEAVSGISSLLAARACGTAVFSFPDIAVFVSPGDRDFHG